MGVLFATSQGSVVFGNVPIVPTYIGVLVIIRAGVYVWPRETQARRTGL
ncbi:MAG: hypothetical protein ACI8TF_002554 [Paracoccaceae bacterium]|jgi:hypothetical protein